MGHLAAHAGLFAGTFPFTAKIGMLRRWLGSDRGSLREGDDGGSLAPLSDRRSLGPEGGG
jgi:hypothetical protein